MLRMVFLTFDVEDFTNNHSVTALQSVLELLNKYDFKGIFFLTGHMAEKIQDYPNVIELLEEHEIGYHSSSHSVHPTVFEFTDVENYDEAYRISLERETSHINPLSGEIEGLGGILFIKDLFPSKQIIAYRAPGCCWSPPHTEALRDLGIKFDFSSNISQIPVYYNGLTFYPSPIFQAWNADISNFRIFWISAIKRQYIIMGFHPSLFVTYDGWDRIYHNGNPIFISSPALREINEIKRLFYSFDLYLKHLKLLEKIGLIEVTTNVTESKIKLVATKNLIEKTYIHSIKWAKKTCNYKPKFLRLHFFRFFNFPVLG
ncbi:MAG: polysaccharide deacetylase family protein [Nitrososphaeria archaeon]